MENDTKSARILKIQETPDVQEASYSMTLSSSKPEAIQYPNQPLKEVDFELRFFGEPVVEAKRHEFFEAIRDQYPLVFVPALKQGMHPSLQHYKFEREDGSAGITLALNSLGYFQREYEGARAFLTEVERISTIANKLFSIKRFSRMGWRYINSIPFTRESDLIPLSRFFNKPPGLFSIESHEFSSINFNATTKYEEEFVTAKLLSDQSLHDGNELLVFDIDVYKDDLGSTGFKFEHIPDLAGRLHNIARNFFEESITENYRDYLKDDTL